MRMGSEEEAASQVAAQQSKRELRKAETESDPQNCARHANRCALNEQLGQQAALRDAQDADERKLRPSQGYRQGLRRIDQKTAGQERDHGQHLKVHAIGAGEAVAALGCIAQGDELGVSRKEAADCSLDGRAVDARGELEVDPVQAAELTETPLCCGYVDNGEALGLAGAGQRANDMKSRDPPAGGQGYGLTDMTSHGAQGRRRKRNGVFSKGRGLTADVLSVSEIPDKFRRGRCGAQNIDAQQGELALGAAGALRLQLYDGAGDGDPVYVRKDRIEALCKSGPRNAVDLQVGVTIDGLQGAAKLIERRAVDQVDCEAEGDANRDRQDRQEHPPGPGAPFPDNHPA